MSEQSLSDGHPSSIVNSSDRVARLPEISVVVPAYNEEGRLGATLVRMLAYFDEQGYPFELIVVDDGSSDATRAVTESIASARPEVRLISYKPNHGKGYAVRQGMLAAEGERILLSDADLATPIEEVEKLLAKLQDGYDIAIGSRDVKGSQLIRHQSWLRETGGKAFNQLVQMVAVPGIHDTQCGFKLFSRVAARAIFSRCTVDHFAFDVEVLYLAIRFFGYRIAETPVRWAHQEGSKVVFWRDGMRMVRTLFRIRMTHYEPAASAAKLNPR